MKRRLYRHRLLVLSTAVLLGISGLSPSVAGATEVTADTQAVADTTDMTSEDTSDAVDGEAAEETTEPERLEPDAYFEPIQSNATANWHRGLPYGQNQPLSWIWTAGLSCIPKTWMSQSILPVSPRFSPH